MKLTITLSAVILSTIFLTSTGCGKKEDASAPNPPTQGAVADTANKATATAQGQTEVVNKTAQDAATTASTQAAAVTNQVQGAAATAPAAADKAQGIIDQAKKLLADNKASEALTSLKGLNGLQLTPEQQSAVQSLKDQIQKALAGSAVGGLLQPK